MTTAGHFDIYRRESGCSRWDIYLPNVQTVEQAIFCRDQYAERMKQHHFRIYKVTTTKELIE